MSNPTKSTDEIIFVNENACTKRRLERRNQKMIETPQHLMMSNYVANCPTNSPTIYNNTEYPIVVFCERVILYNKQMLYPGDDQ
mmetsp:Transcript_38347/g.43257  ORF Transcript_38347/g.43257 Transcript_38347/m.43257 type:complete len:84 (+) Transcript_38347:34-285(+)